MCRHCTLYDWLVESSYTLHKYHVYAIIKVIMERPTRPHGSSAPEAQQRPSALDFEHGGLSRRDRDAIAAKVAAIAILPRENIRSEPSSTSSRRSRIRVGNTLREGTTASVEQQRDTIMLAERAQLKEALTGQSGSSQIWMPRHERQRRLEAYRGGVDGCVPTSMANALQALGLRRFNDGEDSFIREIQGRDGFIQGHTDLGTASEILRERGIRARSPAVNSEPTLIPMFNTLAQDGVAILSYNRHARLISGFDVDNGDLSFRVNDPLREEVTHISIDEMVDGVVASGGLHSVALIEASAGR